MSLQIHVPKDQIEAFCHRHNIRRFSFFGSVLRSDFDASSDVDVLVEFEPGRSPGLRFFEMEGELSRLLGRKVDLHTPGFLSRYIRERVVQEAEVQYEAA